MAESESKVPSDGKSSNKDGASTALLSEVVAPGEEETDLENRKNDFDRSRSAVWMQSAASGIQREKWGSKTQFLMSCIASAVGLGNVSICATNGGATFLIPYVIVLFVIARPLFVLELTLGQFSSKGSVRCWDLSPAFTGIGFTGMVSSVLLSTFYIMLLAWALIYSVIAFISICYDPGKNEPLWGANTGFYFGNVIIQEVPFDLATNKAPHSAIPICHLVLALIFAWMIIWVTMVFGVEASGKVAYVTALAPYVVLIILLAAGLNLPGMEIGLEYLFYPDAAKLFDGNTWFQAVGQCFFSLGIGFGGCIMFSSFNDFHNDIIRDVLIISIVDSVTSILAGISLLSILGFQAKQKFDEVSKNETGDPYKDLLKCANGKYKSGNKDEMNKEMTKCALKNIIGDVGGAGLAFVHYPAAMNKINQEWGAPFGTILGLLFFLMLILLAVGSANGFVGTTVTILADKHPKWKRSNIVSGVCAFSCFLGLIYTNPIGAGWFDVVDIHGVTAVVYILAFLEVFAVIYVYGLKNFCDDIEYMRNGKSAGWYLKITWVALPVLMVIIYMYWLATYKISKHWTAAVVAVAWLITICCLMIIPANIVLQYIEFRRNPWRRNVPLRPCSILAAIFHPNPRWGPKDPQIRIGWKEFKAGRDPSYHILRRMRALFNRILRKPEPLVHPTPRISYATAAFPPESGSGLDSVNIDTPTEEKRTSNVAAEEKRASNPTAKKKRSSNVVSAAPSN